MAKFGLYYFFEPGNPGKGDRRGEVELYHYSSGSQPGAVTHKGAANNNISMEIRPILTPRGAAKFFNNSVRVP